MAAGDSARREAERARKAASRLDGKARHAAFAAENWERGASGEEITAAALAPLEASGWRILHDRRAPDGGNVDHLAVGPPGVAVIDAKNWNGAVTVTPDRRVVVTKHDKTADVDRLAALVEDVRSWARREGMNISVRGYLSLTGESDRARSSSDLGDIRIVGVEQLVKRLDSRRRDLDDEGIAAVAESLAAELPPMDGPVAVAPAAGESTRLPTPSAMFEKAHRFYYFVPWRKGGHDRLYLNDRSGVTVGWTDVNTGATTVECGPDDEPFARALLAAADKTGIKLEPGEVPRVPTRLFGGRLLSRIAGLHTSLLVGQEWRGHGHHRLYGTLVDPKVDTFTLGWVDLKSGELHPSSTAPLHPDRHEPARYLAYLLHHRPSRDR